MNINIYGQVSSQKASCPEKWWAITHPFVACKAKKITRQVLIITREVKHDTLLDGNDINGQVDAFRHSFWMASLAQKMNPRKAIKLGKAHEKGNYKLYKKGLAEEEKSLPDSVSGAMDLYNNDLGARIGCNNACVDSDSLKKIVISEIRAGHMRIISLNTEGKFLDCAGNVLDMKKYDRMWNIPKCLVPSNKK